MKSKRIVKGFKVFNPDWTCSPYGNTKQYTCPGKFEEDIIPILCGRGMHFCKKAVDCFNYYNFDPNNHVAEIIAYGDIEEGNKCCTNKLEIVREIPWAELLEMVNTGKGCTGFGNSGSYNSGYYNSGSYNSGNLNSGDYNSGNRNSGDGNSGNLNSGDDNSGSYNSGSRNSGNLNSGSCNSGNLNSGDWNKCSFSNGCFNTVAPKIYLFNKPSDWTLQDWRNSKACYLLHQISGCVWREIESMTDEEKEAHPEAAVAGGYLKILDSQECAVLWWQELTASDKAVITGIPNFDKEIFKEITGIDVDTQ